MSERDDGGTDPLDRRYPPTPAFPTPQDILTDGMTLRDHFACEALPAVLAALAMGDAPGDSMLSIKCLEATAAIAAVASYRIADAMLRERRK